VALPPQAPLAAPKPLPPHLAPQAGPAQALSPAERAQQALLSAESYTLAQELFELVDGARAAEARMVEVAALSGTFASHVAAQASVIEALYTSACESSSALARGNAELETTLRRSGGARRTTAALLFGASAALLLLDWLS
jgi:hypothetical protein